MSRGNDETCDEQDTSTRVVRSKKPTFYRSFSSSSSSSSSPSSPSKGEEYLRDKTFIARESRFTMVLENSKEAKAVYTMVASQIFMVMIYTLLKYYADRKAYDTDVTFITSQLTGISAFFDSWVKMHFMVILYVYPVTKLWMVHGCQYSLLYLASLLPAFMFMLIHPVYTLLENNFLYILTFSMTVEQVRMLMKTISFIVENHRKVVEAKKATATQLALGQDGLNKSSINGLSYRGPPVTPSKGLMRSITDSNGNDIETLAKTVLFDKSSSKMRSLNYCLPTLNQLIYFLFAPTLIYRDSYPRTPGTTVNWCKVASLLGEFGSLIFLGLQIVTRITVPRLKRVGIEPLRVTDMIDDYIRLTMISVLCTFGLGYGFLHCWLNAWAEMLHFADREFYKEWWAAKNFPQFWRRWNGVVQPWIYEYLYKPTIYLTNGNRFMATFTVFLASALVHEHVTGFALGGLLPMFFVAMFFFFPFIVAFHFLRNLDPYYSGVFIFAFNWIVWSTTMYGYGLEVFARVNCPLSNDETLIQTLKPRLLSCLQVKW